MVKWVNRVTLRGAVADWKVKMYGLKRKNGTRQTYTLDRASYDSCATPGCHGSSWIQPDHQKTWSGVPLFLCIGKVDGGKGHDSYGAYNEALALKGYRIKLVVGDRQVRDHRLAHDPQPRPASSSPTSCMGSELTAQVLPAAARRAGQVRAATHVHRAASPRSTCCPSEPTAERRPS